MCIFTLITSLFYFITRENPTLTAKLINNLVQLGLALILVVSRMKWDTHFYNPFANRVCIIFEAFYLWLVLSNFFGIAISSIMTSIDFDYLLLLFFPFTTWVVFNLVSWKSRSVTDKSFDSKSKTTMDQSMYFYERLYFSFMNQQVEENKAFLYARMIDHTRGCTDPCCLCHLARIPFDLR